MKKVFLVLLVAVLMVAMIGAVFAAKPIQKGDKAFSLSGNVYSSKSDVANSDTTTTAQATGMFDYMISDAGSLGLGLSFMQSGSGKYKYTSTFYDLHYKHRFMTEDSMTFPFALAGYQLGNSGNGSSSTLNGFKVALGVEHFFNEKVSIFGDLYYSPQNVKYADQSNTTTNIGLEFGLSLKF